MCDNNNKRDILSLTRWPRTACNNSEH